MQTVEVQCLACGYRGWGKVEWSERYAICHVPLYAWCRHEEAEFVRIVATGAKAVLAR